MTLSNTLVSAEELAVAEAQLTVKFADSSAKTREMFLGDYGTRTPADAAR
jgi:hypothetical protein